MAAGTKSCSPTASTRTLSNTSISALRLATYSGYTIGPIVPVASRHPLHGLGSSY
jgi:hypothetical protein